MQLHPLILATVPGQKVAHLITRSRVRASINDDPSPQHLKLRSSATRLRQSPTGESIGRTYRPIPKAQNPAHDSLITNNDRVPSFALLRRVGCNISAPEDLGIRAK